MSVTALKLGAVLCRPGHQPPLGPSLIRLEAGRIAAIEPLDPAALSTAEAGLIALPPPADAHDHGRGLRSAAFAADDALEIWLAALAHEPKIDAYLRAAVGFARLAESGVCAANHCHNTQDRAQLVAEAAAVARAAREVGIRIGFAVPFIDRNLFTYGDLEPLLALLPPEDRARAARAPARSVAEMMANFDAICAFEHEYFRVQYGPVGPQWVSDQAMIAVAERSARDDRRVHLHLLETARQREWADAQYPRGIVSFLDSIGLLSPRLTVAHGVWIRPDEAELLAKRGVTVSINLSSNLRLRSGLPPLRQFAAANLVTGIGLDGMALDDDEDMLRELRLNWHLQRQCDLTPFPASRIFDAACIDGRRSILGEDGGGTLSVGAPGDVLVLDYGAMTRDLLVPPPAVTDILLTRMTRAHVHALYVGGRAVVENSACVSVNLPQLQQQLHDQARERLNADPARTERLQAALRQYYGCGCHIG